jgi:anti-sigma regulatory factor (Ser/Thr protein kinase)
MRVPHTLTWQYRDAWPGDAKHIADARTFVGSRLGEHGLADAAVVLRLVVSELATNAVLHAATPFTVTLTREQGSLRLVVSDGLRVRVPDPKPRPPTEPDGRGLGIVERLSTAWGVSDDVDGKSVWAVFELPVAVPSGARAV